MSHKKNTSLIMEKHLRKTATKSNNEGEGHKGVGNPARVSRILLYWNSDLLSLLVMPPRFICIIYTSKSG